MLAKIRSSSWQRFATLFDNTSMIYLLAVTILAALVALGLWRRYLTTISDVPGPVLASVSRAWYLWRLVRGDIDTHCIALHEKHGPFVRISHDEISVCHPEAIRQVLLSPLPKAEWYEIMSLPDARYQTPMSATDPKEQVRRSKNLAAGFALSHVIKSEPYIDGCIRLLKTRLLESARSEKQVHLDEWFNYMAFDIIGEVIFSQRFGFLEAGKDLGGSIANSRLLVPYVTMAGFFQTFHRLTVGNPRITDWNLMPTQHILDTTLRAIEARKKNPDVREDVLSLWMRQHESHPERLSEKELHGCVNMTVGAASDTVSASLQSFFYHLIRHPQHLATAKQEIADANLTEDIVAYANASKLPFLQACLKEGWRMFPPVPFGLARVVPTGGVTISGRYFEPGTKLSVNPRVIHYSRELFGQDACTYNPHRWIGPQAKDIEKYFIAFGAGYNSCQGRNIAQLEIFKAAATLLRDLDFKQVDPAQEWKYEASFAAVPHGWPCYVSESLTAVSERKD
ncbi:cytochrome P450 [Boeremia exigua]|uniref:cytochrome P450 n=1 Tax=Boeremia exigua TaxID=749465 RepID=UPI001E8CB992|nr:cytochrome P450 [Boeremia exigua]KAH6616598.1 cytochrome P450 [Boeremia exigua]